MSVIYAYIGVVLGVNVGIYGIHGVSGIYMPISWGGFGDQLIGIFQQSHGSCLGVCQCAPNGAYLGHQEGTSVGLEAAKSRNEGRYQKRLKSQQGQCLAKSHRNPWCTGGLWVMAPGYLL